MPADPRHNILQLGSSIDTGGAERVIANLTRHVDRNQFNLWPCHLFSPCGAIGDELKRDGYEVLDVGRDPGGIQRYFSSRLLTRLVRRMNIKLIHTHTQYALIDATLCSIATRGRVKVLHTFHYGNYPHLLWRYLLTDRVGARCADGLVAVGIEQEKRVREALWLRQGLTRVIANGVDAITPRPDVEWQARLGAAGAVVIGTVCTFIEQKGLPELLQVAANLRDCDANAVFVVVGDGVLRSSIEGQCRSMGLAERVLFTGWKQNASASMMPLFDIFFQPSRWEAMSMVVLEAMAAAKPVVATAVGDNMHVIKEGESGFTVPAGDVAAMAAALGPLVASVAMRKRFGESGRQRHAERYRVAHMVNRYEDLYHQLLATDRPARHDLLKPPRTAATL